MVSALGPNFGRVNNSAPPRRRLVHENPTDDVFRNLVVVYHSDFSALRAPIL
jgi:hypothetical protein